ncbi:glycosyltransferase [Seminavis robusta]|uniref:Glycosyltransferase n=1 Tax=Seminavis robusta TaxID=568900 RepID=A0A9N8ER27_9STRA|nr:glycosyltransferase [Seminavis robusta]|eukprot:Sro1707_g292630.1 glycosyltransferase (415) ;mRNA; r:17110-18526
MMIPDDSSTRLARSTVPAANMEGTSNIKHNNLKLKLMRSLIRTLIGLSVLKMAYDAVQVQEKFQRGLRASSAHSTDESMILPAETARQRGDDEEPTADAQEISAATATTTRKKTPLSEIVRADEQVTCPHGLYPVQQIVNSTADMGRDRKIPRIIHMTGESKCLTEIFYNNTRKWSLDGHSFYFHDYQAKQQLLQRFWPEFPHIQIAYECLKNAGGAAVADLWRYLALWEYGGIYTDMDNEPGKLFHADAIDPDIDGFFLRSSVGLPSQYFFGISPKHPLMFLAVHDVLKEMLALADVGTFYVPGTTGPRCIRRAFLKFVSITNRGIDSATYNSYAYPEAGKFVGMLNRSVDIVGNDTTREQYVKTSSLHHAKKTDWKLMNHTDYYKLNKIPQHKTCLKLLLEQHLESIEQQEQ